ncbi:efflux RND transporter periplasmic adaptor subunit [Bdellovibrio sp. KM01]|uniref:efflux RND transporter periplasmic adaptor subunit n=1 Tax=Bdellovibrio sp. KM01 TaxID=2748865 RepID=UPI0015EA04D2|nr:efflux RND transporter periplasmic adaptor subunit [Bdellovibrio sp. KM01]QLY23874.1 efflux RND transporter periplasmic adaptor subunit [Bdellovibrio sp. KM01]
MNKKKIVPVVIIVVLILVAFLVRQYLFRTSFRYAGTIEVTKVDVPLRVQAVISHLPVKEGMIVEKGQKLVSLSCEDIKISYELAKSTYRRSASLFKSGNISAESYDQVRSKKDDLETRVGWCEVVSPLKGTVLTKYFEEGEMVNPGAKLVTIGNLEEVYAYFYLPHDEIASIKINQQVEVTLPEMDDKKFPGVIEFINPDAEFTPKNVQTRDERTRLVFGVKIRFANKEGILKPGMTLEWK